MVAGGCKQVNTTFRSQNLLALFLPSDEIVYENISKASVLNNFFVSVTVKDSHTKQLAAQFITEDRLPSIRLKEEQDTQKHLALTELVPMF